MNDSSFCFLVIFYLGLVLSNSSDDTAAAQFTRSVARWCEGVARADDDARGRGRLAALLCQLFPSYQVVCFTDCYLHRNVSIHLLMLRFRRCPMCSDNVSVSAFLLVCCAVVCGTFRTVHPNASH